MAIIIPDPDLKGQRGHNANYNFSIAEALSQQGIESILLVDKGLKGSPSHPGLTTVRVFSSITGKLRILLSRLANLSPVNRKQGKAASTRQSPPPQGKPLLKGAKSLLAPLLKLIQPMNEFGHLWALITQAKTYTGSGDIVLISVYTPMVLLTRAIWLNTLGRKQINTTIVILQHAKPVSDWLYRLETRCMCSWTRAHRLVFVAHTPPLASYCEKITGKPCSVLPYPFTFPSVISENTIGNAGGESVTFLYLGSSETRRGFEQLVGAIEAMRDLLNSGRLKFRIQAYKWTSSNEQEDAAFQQIQQYGQDQRGVELIQGSLPTQAYYDELGSADLVLILHRPEYFQFARSGVFSEALSLGKPVIVSRGTFMAEELEQHGAGISFDVGNPDSLHQAIRTAFLQIEPLRNKALKAQIHWCHLHNPARFTDKLLHLANNS